jgi:hypothetical protein
MAVLECLAQLVISVEMPHTYKKISEGENAQ